MQLCFAEVKSQLMLDGNWFLLIVFTSKCKRYQVEQLDANNNTPRATSMTISITTRRLQLQRLINLIEMLARINKIVETLSEPRYLKVWCIYFETKIATYKNNDDYWSQWISNTKSWLELPVLLEFSDTLDMFGKFYICYLIYLCINNYK